MTRDKKITLLSVYKDPNYGSMLQAYALYAVLNKLGYTSEYLNYTNYTDKPFIIRLLIKCFKSILNAIRPSKSIWNTRYFKKQHRIFDEFQRNHIPDSVIKYNPSNIQLANYYYSIFIIGSDQMWSPFVTALPNSINFLDFVKEPNIKASYAPSIGTTHMSKDYIMLLKTKLKSFRNISCREYTNSLLLSNELKRPVKYVLDPTLLINEQDWSKLFEPIDMPKEYVLCYILGTKKCISEYAENLGLRFKIPVYYIITNPIYFARKNTLRYTSVGQFLYLIKNAKYVVTDSFHGSILSINFEVNFYSFSKRPLSNIMNDNDRIIDFLDRIGLRNRYKNDDDKTYNDDIDYRDTKMQINQLRKASIEYLKSIIRENE